MKQAIFDELEALLSHFPSPNRTPEVHMRWLRDYVDDLGNVPPETVRRACQSWRQNGKERFPNPGQLIGLIKALTPRTDVQDVKAWEPISEETYQELSLEDKARHHMICGNRAELEAGPMMRAGVLLTSDQMTADWHHLRAKARWHFEEASKLRGFKRDRPKVNGRDSHPPTR